MRPKSPFTDEMYIHDHGSADAAAKILTEKSIYAM